MVASPSTRTWTEERVSAERGGIPRGCVGCSGLDLPLPRRDFLRLGGAGIAALAAPAAADTATSETGYPIVNVAPMADIAAGAEIAFEYPDGQSPAVLLRLPAPARGGIGPGESVVAFSTLCTHKGCPVAYRAERGMFICPCHWSTFDPAKSGALVIGQASEPLPQIRLRVQDGIVQAVGLEGLIYGRHTNIL
jgi:arsenite oxidase small subunit